MSDVLSPQYTKAERESFKARAEYYQRRIVVLSDQLIYAQEGQRRYERLAQEDR